MEIHVDDLSSTTQYTSAITEPKELSFLKDRLINLDELNYLAKRMDSFFGDEETQFFEAIKLEHFTDMKDLINLTFNLDKYTLIKDVSDNEGVYKANSLAQTVNNLINPQDLKKLSAVLDYADVNDSESIAALAENLNIFGYAQGINDYADLGRWWIDNHDE